MGGQEASCGGRARSGEGLGDQDHLSLHKRFPRDPPGAVPYVSTHHIQLLSYRFFVSVGFDLEKNVYSPYGSASQKFSTTAKPDIGRAVGSLALLALDSSTVATVPDEVRIAGSTVSYEEVRDIVSSVKGVPRGEIEVLDLDKLEQSLRDQKGKGSILDYLR